ncbi:hypothetical protein D3C86_1917850 [compost metagenome]
MHDQCGGGTLARGFLELVGPAAVVGHALAVEQLFVIDMEARVVDEHHHRLALPVLAGVIVPLLLRCIHAVADEDEVTGIDLHFCLAGTGAHHHVGAELQFAGLAVLGER